MCKCERAIGCGCVYARVGVRTGFVCVMSVGVRVDMKVLNTHVTRTQTTTHIQTHNTPYTKNTIHNTHTYHTHKHTHTTTNIQTQTQYILHNTHTHTATHTLLHTHTHTHTRTTTHNTQYTHAAHAHYYALLHTIHLTQYSHYHTHCCTPYTMQLIRTGDCLSTWRVCTIASTIYRCHGTHSYTHTKPSTSACNTHLHTHARARICPYAFTPHTAIHIETDTHTSTTQH